MCFTTVPVLGCYMFFINFENCLDFEFPAHMNFNSHTLSLLYGQALDFPGGKVEFTSDMNFISESADKRVPCYRVLDDDGELIVSKNFVQVSLKLVQAIQ